MNKQTRKAKNTQKGMFVTCNTFYNKRKRIPVEKMSLRLSAFGLIAYKDKILLIQMKHTGKLFFPGGGINLGERVEVGLQREIKEETGIKVKIKKFLFFKESFFYYDPDDLAFHNLALFFICEPLNLKLATDSQVKDDEAIKPRWLNLKKLSDQDFQSFGYEILQTFLEKENACQIT